MKNKFIASTTLFLFLLTILPIHANAVIQSSDQIDYGWVDMETSTRGQIAVEFFVVGTGRMTKIGADCITLYEKNSNSWKEAEVRTSWEYPAFCKTQAISHSNMQYFQVVSGRQYYVKVTVFATNSQGTDYRTYTSSVITAK